MQMFIYIYIYLRISQQTSSVHIASWMEDVNGKFTTSADKQEGGASGSTEHDEVTA